MICLGIESTAHTFGASVVKDGTVLSNVKDLYTTEEEGMIPFKVAEHHLNVCDFVVLDALKKARVKISDIDLISFSQSPGLGHTLRIGAMMAKSLSKLNNIPIVGVNHCIAHLEIGITLTKCSDPVFLYASGANTQVIAYAESKYRVFGESLDIGAGNFLDTLARHMGLGFPGGPKIYDLSKKFNPKKHSVIKLPYSVKGMDVNFGGILTYLKRRFDSKEFCDIEIAYSAQEYIFAMLIEISERAMVHCEKKELLLGGGVACNLRLQEMAKIMCLERGAKCYILPNEYNVDNAAMIGILGIKKFNSSDADKLIDLDIMPYLRTDDVNVTWR